MDYDDYYDEMNKKIKNDIVEENDENEENDEDVEFKIEQQNDKLFDKIWNLWGEMNNYIHEKPLNILQNQSFNDFYNFYLSVTKQSFK